MVWISSSKSLAKNEVSFLAIIEIILAIGIYWGLAIYFDTYWHLFLSIFIAPFLLLQSKQSIELSLKKLNNYTYKSSKFLFNGILIGLPLLSFFYIIYFPIDSRILLTFSYIILFLFLIIILVVPFFFMLKPKKAIQLSLTLSSPYMSLVKTIIYIFFSIKAKIVGTILNLKYGYINFSSNWFRRIFIIDMVTLPEIITGIENDTKNDNNSFHISKLWQFVKLKKEIYDELFKEQDINTMWAFKIASIVELIGFYFIVFIYRLSIKSTFWFYIPLLFVVKKPNLETPKQIGKFLSELYETTWVKVRGFLALLTLGAFIVTHFNYFSFESIDSPFGSILSLIYLDFSSLEMWKIFQLLVAIITIGLFFYANAIRVPNISNHIPLQKDIHIKTIYYLNSIRNWFSLFYLLSAFIFLAVHLKIWEYKYAPNFLNNFFTTLLEYIRYVPFN